MQSRPRQDALPNTGLHELGHGLGSWRRRQKIPKGQRKRFVAPRHLGTFTVDAKFHAQLELAAGSGEFELNMALRIYRERPEVSRRNKPLALSLWNFLTAAP